ncbi:Copine family protein [Histomonas meleagridis]|uniref:Copine family protein n=1 Tax=Histomonas meleagridis TaxID=135588 RepID=UPI003559E347|nr:Copine family protein [Histomonas meleagridis]KAH0802318.1 Copine family protein [Histomonas meleagridis]
MKVAFGSYNNIPIQRRDVANNYTGTDSVAPCADALNQGQTYPLVNLHVSAKNLKDMDVITVSDPVCALYTFRNGKWEEFSRTEVIWNNLNPEWVTFFTVMYIFEIRQPLLFRVYDVDSENADLSKQDFIGEAQIELSQIISAEGTTELTLKIPKSNENRGTLFVTPEQVENSGAIVQGQIIGKDLKKQSFFFRNTPFFVIAKSSEQGRYLPIFQSEVSRPMSWKPFTIPYQVLCNVDPDRPLRISFYNHKSHSAAVLIGYFDTTFSQLSEKAGQTVQVIDKNRKIVGNVIIRQISLQQKFNFYDYLHGGIQLNLITAIDFTASNRDPRDPHSLHYISPNGDSINQYERCIRGVGEVLCPYDTDQLFPVLGFGAKIGGRINHCFPLTFNDQAPCVRGLDGILDVYRNALTQVQLSGPTLFAPIIRYASQLSVQSFQQDRTYTILTIITDGIINDMEDTIDAIVDAGRIPLSIIIVGVGNADFTAMDVLDADDTPLVSRSGFKMVRDLVQFVPFNKFVNQHYSVLAAAVLEEVPRQLCEWAEMNGVRPNGA